MKLIYLTLALTLISTSCTENTRAKSFGGEQKVNLPANTKFINATWKNDSLWYVTRPMRADETPETFALQEKSSYGIVEGKILFIESK